MIRKMLPATLLASALCAQAEAAHFVTVSVKAGFQFDVTFDMTTADAAGTVFADSPDFSADIDQHLFELFGSTPDFIDYFVQVDLSGYDLSPAEFTYHDPSPNGGWFADFLYSLGQYQFLGSVSGGAYNLDVVGSDSPRLVAVQVSGNNVPPGVPEPASWGLMLAGFGLIGGALRARRKAIVTFA